MKKTKVIIVIFSIVLITTGMQAGNAGEYTNDSSDTLSSSIDYLKMGTPYLEKGLLYLGIAGILIIIWLFLQYKV